MDYEDSVSSVDPQEQSFSYGRSLPHYATL